MESSESFNLPQQEQPDGIEGQELRDVQSEMIQQERTTLMDKFQGASDKVRALMKVFVISTAMSGGVAHAPEQKKMESSQDKSAAVESVEDLKEPVEKQKIDADGTELLKITQSLPQEIVAENYKGATRFLQQVETLPEGAELIESKDNADIYYVSEGEKLAGKYASVDERFNQIILFESQSPEHASVWAREFVAQNPVMDEIFKDFMAKEKRLRDQGFLEVGAYKDNPFMTDDEGNNITTPDRESDNPFLTDEERNGSPKSSGESDNPFLTDEERNNLL